RAAMSSGQQMSILRDSIKSGAIDVPLGSALLEGNASQPPEQSESRREMLALVELRRKTRQIQVSTDDREVRAYLRQLGEPICLFGEDAADRRERLKTLIVLHGESAIRKRPAGASDSAGDSEAASSTAGASTSASGAAINKEVWYHEGPEALKTGRLWLAEYSLPRARARLDAARAYYANTPDSVRKARHLEWQNNLRSFAIQASQIGDSRPLSYCQVSPDGSQLAVSSWSGLCQVWRLPECELAFTLRGHKTNACCVAWHPKATTPEAGPVALASSSLDGAVKLWSLDSESPYAELDGHEPYRVSRLAWHPSGRFLGTCVFDYSWRLWDLEAGDEILHQEGHSKEVYDIAFHPDGSLALTGGLDSFGRVWDLRTGRCVMLLEGHQRSVLSVAFAPNGHHMATGSEDNGAKLWDLRKQVCLYTVPAHTSNVSKVLFQPGSSGAAGISHFLLTASYDGSARLWSHPNWTPIHQLSGHESRLMCADIAPDSRFIVTCGFDRTFKLWAAQPI
ncbi:hypothetical protein BOX15_Mlig007912g1, partial [Macrostomum lignano]